MKKYKYRKSISINGKRYEIVADTLTELGQKMERKRQAVENDPNTVSSGMLLRYWADKCIEAYKTNQRPETRKKYVSRVNHCIMEHIGDMPLRDIRPMHCQQVLNLQAGKSKTQINEVYQALRFLFGKACDNGLLKTDPTTGLTRPAGYRNSRRALTATEREAFIAVGKTDRRYYYFLLMLFCGCRPSEAEACKGADLLMKNGVPALHIRGTKTKNADRYVPVPAEFWELIEHTPKGEYIAQTSTGGSIGVNNRRRVWESYKRQLNIYMGCKVYRNALVPPYPLAPDLVPYCLRHEYCTELARRDVDIRAAQRLMGHADMKLTANIYTNLQADDMADVFAELHEGPTSGPTSECDKM